MELDSFDTSMSDGDEGPYQSVGEYRQIDSISEFELSNDSDVDSNRSLPSTGSEQDSGYSEEIYDGAGEVLGVHETPFTRLHANQINAGNGNPYHPFTGLSDWEVAEWLHYSGLSAPKVDAFLRLKHNEGRALCIQDSTTLQRLISQLPDPKMPWICQSVVPESGKEAHMVSIYYRDPLCAIKSLLLRPSLAKHMDFAPRKVKLSGEERLFSEIFTGKWAWEVQNSLSRNATLIPVFLSIQVKELAGSKKMWSLYLSIGNIISCVRNDPATHSWVAIGHIPFVEFLDDKSFSGVLKARLFHQCLKLILAPLCVAGKRGLIMGDSIGSHRRCFPRLAAVLADHTDQLIINIANGSSSPTSTVTQAQFGSASPHPPHTFKWIIARIQEASKAADPRNLQEYTSAAQRLGLNGVHKPFWQDLPGYEPNVCIAPDLDHGLLLFWRDHIRKWTVHLVGIEELNKRLKLLQPIVGVVHFGDGIPHLSNWTEREDQDVQHVLIAIIHQAPGVTPQIMDCLRAIHEFVYLARYHMHSTATLSRLEDALRTFHAGKDAFLETATRSGNTIPRHFDIPKLAGLYQFPLNIPQLGTSPQFRSSIIEGHCHDVFPPPLDSEHNGIEAQMAQMCQMAEKGERICLMAGYVSWIHRGGNHQVQNDRRSPSDLNYWEHGPSVRHIPDRLDNVLNSVARIYSLPGLRASLTKFLDVSGEHSQEVLNQIRIDIWDRLEIRGCRDPDMWNPRLLQVVEALPPLSGMPNGRNHCILLKNPEVMALRIRGHRVCQVRLIFRLHFANSSHTMHLVPLVYVDWFSRSSAVGKGTGMYTVQRHLDDGGNVLGSVAELQAIDCQVQLIPKFSGVVMPSANEHNGLDVYEQFHLNSFADLETYHTIK